MEKEVKLPLSKRITLWVFNVVYLSFLYFVYSGYFGAKGALIVSVSIPIIIFILGMIYLPRKSKN